MVLVDSSELVVASTETWRLVRVLVAVGASVVMLAFQLVHQGALCSGGAVQPVVHRASPQYFHPPGPCSASPATAVVFHNVAGAGNPSETAPSLVLLCPETDTQIQTDIPAYFLSVFYI